MVYLDPILPDNQWILKELLKRFEAEWLRRKIGQDLAKAYQSEDDGDYDVSKRSTVEDVERWLKSKRNQP